MLSAPTALFATVSLLLLAASSPAAAQVEDSSTMCFSCSQCNSVGIATPTASGRFCRKSVLATEISRAAVDSCMPVPKVVYCCNTLLCNAGPETARHAGVVMVMASAIITMVTAFDLL